MRGCLANLSRPYRRPNRHRPTWPEGRTPPGGVPSQFRHLLLISHWSPLPLPPTLWMLPCFSAALALLLLHYCQSAHRLALLFPEILSSTTLPRIQHFYIRYPSFCLLFSLILHCTLFPWILASRIPPTLFQSAVVLLHSYTSDLVVALQISSNPG